MNYVIACLICFSLCALTAYMDIYTFFSEKKISVISLIRVFSADAFIVLNGFVGLAILVWAIMDPKAKINAVLSFDSAIGKGVLIGISIPILIRSKLFSITTKEGSSSAGLEAIYEWIKYNVLRRVLRITFINKKKKARTHAINLEGKTSVPEKILDCVYQLARPFKSDEELEELKKEYGQIEHRYDGKIATIDHLQELFEWAMDNAGISSMERYLEDLKVGPSNS